MDKKDIVIRIKQLRDRANLSARELSLRLGKNECYINKIESSQFFPQLDMLLQIIECCNSTPEEFFHRNLLSYQKDKELLDYFSRLTDKQKDAILNLYKD